MESRRPSNRFRKGIPATCGLHRGPMGFANLMISKQGESFVLDPHVTGECLITLNEESAKGLRDILTDWLG
ncbi:MAG: hypothetical protein WCF33_23335 [Pseudonocardiaceae bacterium]